MSYKKHTWGSGIPNRNKFEEMDSEIQRLAEGGGGLPPTGNLHEILKVGSTGPMWGKADSDFVNYVDTPTHENGSVGAKLSELSEKIANCGDIDVTPNNAHIVGRYIYMDGTIKKYKPIYQSVYIETNIAANGGMRSIDVSLLNVETVLYIDGVGERYALSIDTHMYKPLSAVETVNFVIDVNYQPETESIVLTNHTESESVVMVVFKYTKTTDTPTVI